MTESDPEHNEQDQPRPAEPKSDAEKQKAKARYVWQSLWFQWVLGTIVFFLFLSFVFPPIFWLINKLSPILTPLLLGLGLAYIFSPLTCWAQKRYDISRPVTAGLVLGLVALVLAVTVPLLVMNAVDQGKSFVEKAPQYTQTVLGWMGSSPEDAQERANEFIKKMDWTQFNADAAQKALGVSAGVLFVAIGFVSYAAIFVLVTAFCFFIFTWKLEEIKAWFSDFIPKPYRAETHRILGMMDNTVSAIVRGRLVQSVVLMFVLSIGWWIAGVPYWLLLGVLGGALNLLPFAAVIAWPIAVILTMVDVASNPGGSLFFAALWPTVVYIIAQSLDGWVVEPLVQGQATGMDALTVLLVVLAGGALLGVLGVVLAVPVAACIKILSQELLLPKARAFAENPPDFSQKGQA